MLQKTPPTDKGQQLLDSMSALNRNRQAPVSPERDDTVPGIYICCVIAIVMGVVAYWLPHTHPVWVSVWIGAWLLLGVVTRVVSRYHR